MSWKPVLTVLTAIAATMAIVGAAAASYNWAYGRDAVTGYRYAYPQGLFSPVEGEGRPAYNYFASNDGRAKLLYGAWDAGAGETPHSLKRWMIEEAGGRLTYDPSGRSWFVISGYRGDEIYYQKVMFSCGGATGNVFAITYPTADRATYDAAVERMENVFRPGRNCR